MITGRWLAGWLNGMDEVSYPYTPDDRVPVLARTGETTAVVAPLDVPHLILVLGEDMGGEHREVGARAYVVF